jgi:hypothetical protein
MSTLWGLREDEEWEIDNHSPSQLFKPKAKANGSGELSVEDFYAYMPKHLYLFVPTRELWPAASVNSRLPEVKDKTTGETIKASIWLDKHRPVEQMSWAPGEPMLIQDRLIADGGWFPSNHNCFNLYRPPTVQHGNAEEVGPWLEHVKNVYPNEAGHIICWLAHRVQRPQEKINHALVLGGKQGIGKDTLLEPVKCAVGSWNFSDVTPEQMTDDFNGFLRAVIVRVNEAKDLGEQTRYAFYERMKIYTAAPPDVLRINEKFLAAHYIPNCCGVILTTNYKANGIFLPEDDRRHYVAWSDASKEDFGEAYFAALWEWFKAGGYGHVAAYLANLDLSQFNPQAPPEKTAAFWEIAQASRAPEYAPMADVIEQMGKPPVLTIGQIKAATSDEEFTEFLTHHRSRKLIPYRLEECGYTAVRNPDAKDGLWRVNGKKQIIYARNDLLPREQLAAANRLGK